MWKLATASLTAIDKGNAARIQLFPAGWFGAPDGTGQRWFLDAALANTLIAVAQTRANAYAFDYEHQSLNARNVTGPVPASGWFKSLSWEDGVGLFADVTWTTRAASLIAADEYRYVSPTFRYDEQGNVRALVNAALTNLPVLDGMRQVAASLLFYEDHTQDNPGEHPMNENLRLALCAILGISDQSDESAIAAGVTQLQDGTLKSAQCSSVPALIAAKDTALAQKESALTTARSQVASLSAAKTTPNAPDPTKYVPVEVVNDLRTELSSLSQQICGDKVEALLTAALSDGRVMKGADADNLRELGKTDFTLMEKMVGARQPIRALSQLQTEGLSLDAKGDPTLDGASLAVCNQFADLDEKTFAADLAKELGHGTH